MDYGAIFGLELLALHFPAFTVFKIGGTALWNILLLSEERYSSVSSVQTFTARTSHAAFTNVNHPHFLHIPNIRRNFQSDSFFSLNTATLCNR